MTQLWFSRIMLRKDSQVQAIASLLLPKDRKREILAARHELIWSLFSDGPDRNRDFLWREEKHGLFYTLSARKPQSDLFTIESKPFEPSLKIDDKLAFSLRANPVVTRKSKGKKRGQRHDIVMDRLKSLRPHNPEKGDLGERCFARNDLIKEAGHDWIKHQSEKHGFEVNTVQVDGYHQHILQRRNKNSSGNISTLDFEGTLTITDPKTFLEKLTAGFGSAKAFGCGLMLIRRL